MAVSTRVMTESNDLYFEVASLAGLGQLIQELGEDPAAVATSCGYDLQNLNNPDEVISHHAYERLLETAAQHTNCPHFGLLLGQSYDLSQLGALGLLGRHCADFGTAIQAITRYYNMTSLGGIFRLEQGLGTSVIIREPIIPELTYSVQAQDVTISEALQVTRALLGGDWVPTAIYLTHQPQNTEIYQTVFGCPVYFNQDVQGISFPSELLKKTLNKANERARISLEKKIAKSASQQSKSFTLRVQELIKLGLVTGNCNVQFAADNLFVHRRTVHRRLREEGTTFFALLEETRRKLADHLIQQSPMSIFDISQTLGYADATAFSRSFRRWFNATPSSFRKALF